MHGRGAGSLIRFEGVFKRFGRHEVLPGLDLKIAAGQKVVVVGPSGSGKSTLLRCINQLEEIDGGRLVVLDCDVRQLRGKALDGLRADVGMVFQSFNLFPHKTVLENLTVGPMRVRRMDRAAAEKAAMEWLCRVGIPEKAHQYPRQLSGGQQQRAAIARALAMRPRVMLFDEPTSALDPEWIQEVLQVMADTARQRDLTVVVVTHEMGFARDIADRVVFMDAGLVVEDAPPAEFFSSPRTERAQAFLASIRQLVPRTEAS